METKHIILILSLVACGCHGNAIQREEIDDTDLYDDIRLTPEQKHMVKERGFFTPGKWPLKNGVVTIPYYFDDSSISPDSIIRTNFKAAVNVYTSQTCIRWVEVSKQDSVHKVRVYVGVGCHSNIGMIKDKDNELSLGPGQGCELTSTIIHEMGHAVGMFHTQSRSDRDNYVKVWLQNVRSGMQSNFDKMGGDLYGVPYDYKSVMHYGNSLFSWNGSFTITTLDPYAMFAIGSELTSLRWSDMALISRAYTCDAIYAARCPSVKCVNDGFVGQDCKCKCPENTRGDRCETITGPFFNDQPKCGGVINKPGEISSFVGGVSVTDKCIFKIEAPQCQLPSITFTRVNFGFPDCYLNKLSVQISKEYFGYTWCRNGAVPIGTPFISDSQTAAIYYYTNTKGSTEYGFRAQVNFVNNPSCGNPGPVQPPPPVTGAAITSELSGPCTLNNLGGGTYRYMTPGYPSPVSGKPNCKLEVKPADSANMIFTKVQVSEIKGPDRVTLEDGVTSFGYIQSGKSVTAYLLWPTTVEYSGGSTSGFSVTYTPVSGLPSFCNGNTISLSRGESRSLSNPLVGSSEKNLRCAFKLESAGSGFTIQGKRLGLSAGEYLMYKSLRRQNALFEEVSQTATTMHSSLIAVYYVGAASYAGWEMQVTAF